MREPDTLTVRVRLRYSEYVGNDPDQLLTTAEVARIFRVNERTIRRWTASGDLDDCIVRTPTGKFRYRETSIRRRATPPETRNETR